MMIKRLQEMGIAGNVNAVFAIVKVDSGSITE
jgi:hypothetical protein